MLVIERHIQPQSSVLVSVGQQVSHEDVLAAHQRQGELVRVLVAEQLKVSPRQAMECLTVEIGQKVSLGDLLAKFRALWGLIDEKVIAHCDGTVERFFEVDGAIEMRTPEQKSAVTSLVTGVISSIDERFISIAIQGDLFSGAVGFGSETNGILVTLETTANFNGKKVFALKDNAEFDLLMSNEALRAQTAGIVICEFENERAKEFTHRTHPLVEKVSGLEFSCIVLKRFGVQPMPDELFQSFREKSGKRATLFPITQIRAGGIRPSLVIA